MLLNIVKLFLHETFRLFMEMSPYLIIGFFFAGLLHVFFGESYVRKHFSGSGIWPTIKASLFGVPLPVCSCGVIPLAEAMRRDGASKSSTMSFLVSTPSSGVDSIFATYALLGPVLAVFRPIASFISGITVGVITHFAGNKEKSAEHPDNPTPKTAADNGGRAVEKKSYKEIFSYGFTVIPSEIAKWLIVGVVIGGAISAMVPADFGTRYLHSPLLNYLAILLISIPIYVCATGSIPIAASLIAKGVLPGAALAFLIAGPATNTVTISFVYKKMGRKIAALYIFSITLVAVITGIIFDAIWTKSSLNIDFITAGGGVMPQELKFISAIVLLLVLLNARYNLTRFLKPGRQVSSTAITIKIPDMTCRHCEMKITQAIGELPEAQLVSVNLENREIAVETDGGRDIVVERLKKEGYHPE